MFKEPMDLAVEIWKAKTNPAYRNIVSELAEVGQKLWRARAEELLSLCESYDPIELYEYVEANPPCADVVAELIKMALSTSSGLAIFLDPCHQRCAMTPRSWTGFIASCLAGTCPSSIRVFSHPTLAW